MIEDNIIEPNVERDLVSSPEKPSINLIKANPPAMKRPTFTYRQPSNTDRTRSENDFYSAEYDFVEIGMAEDTDAFVYQANFKKLALAIKAGWTFVSKNQDALNYIRRRIAEIEVAQGQTFWALLVEILSCLLRNHNCFLIKARDIETSSGKVRNVNGKSIMPVAGYFVAAPNTIQFKIGRDNNIKAYKHIMPDGRFKIFPAEDVVHFHIYRKTHNLAGTPAWIPVLEDIVALRRIEEHVENLVYQHIYPLYQYKVGTEKFPCERYQDGLTEVDVVQAKIREMPTDGMLVTPERHEIRGLGAESRALRAETYLEYFKKRVIGGTGLSELDFGYGDTANRSTADSMSKLAIDNVKFYQQNMANTINFEIIRELMLESALNYDHSDDEVRVELQFNEIDVESQIKLQNHYMLMYQGNTIGEAEMRKHIGKEPVGDDGREDMHLMRIDKPRADWQAEADISKANAVAKNRQQPSNQHGKATGPTKRKSSVEKDGAAKEVYSELANDIRHISPRAVDIGLVNQLFHASSERAKQLFHSVVQDATVKGASRFPLTAELRVELNAIASRVNRDFDRDIDRLFRQAAVETSVDLLSDKGRERLAIDALEYRVRFIEKTIIHKAYTLATVAAMKANGIQRARVTSDPDGEDYPIWNNVVIDLQGISPEDLPPFHPNCTCELVPEG